MRIYTRTIRVRARFCTASVLPPSLHTYVEGILEMIREIDPAGRWLLGGCSMAFLAFVLFSLSLALAFKFLSLALLASSWQKKKKLAA